MERESASSRWLTVVVALVATAIIGLLTVLVFLLIRDDNPVGGATTVAAPSTAATTLAPTTALPPTTQPPSTTTQPPSTTVASTTTAAPTTTAVPTTTVPPFVGDTDAKAGAPVGVATDQRVVDIRHAQREGFTRVVFDFEDGGGIPGYWVGYNDPTHLAIILQPIDIGDPFEPGIFNGAGQYPVGTNSVVVVFEGGMGGGSGEWQFDLQVAPNRPFTVGTLDGPPRVYIDIGD